MNEDDFLSSATVAATASLAASAAVPAAAAVVAATTAESTATPLPLGMSTCNLSLNGFPSVIMIRSATEIGSS